MSEYRKTPYQYQPKRPVKSFQDLEVYQKSLALAVIIAKRIPDEGEGAKGSGKGKKTRDELPKAGAISATGRSISHALVTNALGLPVAVASAHSRRFGGSDQAIEKLEQAMLRCNLCVVYLEEYRDIVNADIGHEFFEENIKAYLALRGKLLRLQRSWQKFMGEGGKSDSR